MDIFKYLYTPELRAMTLVATCFRAVATNNLYRELSVDNSELSRLLMSFKLNPLNATITKSVCFRLVSEVTPPESWKELFDLLTHTPNLERLRIIPFGCMNGVEWYPPPLPKLQSFDCKRLRMSAQFTEWLVALPELKCLKMGTIERLCALTTNPSPNSEHLKTIMNNLVEFEGSRTLITYLRDYGKLKYLSISFSEGMEEEWRHLHQVAGATLQFLRVRGMDIMEIGEYHQLLSHASGFSALRYLGVVPLNIIEPPSTMVRHIAFAVGDGILIHLLIGGFRS